MPLALILLSLLFSGCTVWSADRVPGVLVGDEVPEATRNAVADARDLYERGYARQALMAVDPVLAGYPRCVEAHRLQQDVLRTRGRLAWLRGQAADRVARAPDDALSHYLLGRLLPAGGEAQRDAFRLAVRLRPDWLYPWLGYAYSLRGVDPSAAERIYAALYAACPGHRSVAVAYANTLLARGQRDSALAVYKAMLDDPRDAAIGHLGRVQVLLRTGNRLADDVILPSLAMVIRQRPFDPGLHALLAEQLGKGVGDGALAVILDALRADPAALAGFAGSESGVFVLAELFARARQPQVALLALERLEEKGRDPILRRLQRRLYLASGDVRRFLRMLREDLPIDVLDDESNQARAAWRTLLDGPWYERDAQPALVDVAEALDLLTALRDCGLLVEAEAFGGLAALRFDPIPPRFQAVLDEVRREIAFEGRVRRVIQSGYDPDDPKDLDAVLAEIRQVSLEVLGQDVVEPDVRFEVPLVGQMLDPFEAGLCRHYHRYNRHLVLGGRSGGVTEGLSFTRLCVRDVDPSPDLPLPGRCREMVGIDKDLRSLSGVFGGDLAGVALLNHYIVDHDAVRQWAGGLLDRRRILQEDQSASWAAGDGALQVVAGAAEDESLDVSWRLVRMSPVEDTRMEACVLDMIRWHERRHLVDSFLYLPFESNVWRGVRLLMGYGFSPIAIESEMERRAELAALHLSAAPELVLAHIADFLDENDSTSPHVRGFGELGRQLVDVLAGTEGVADAAVVRNWHLLDREAMRRAAGVLFGDLP